MNKSTSLISDKGLFGTIIEGEWKERLDIVVDTVKELSGTSDPRRMLEIFGERVGSLIQRDRSMSLSRRGLPSPKYRITRYSEWEDAADPWTDPEKLPVLEGGLIGELMFGNQPKLLEEFEIDESDPAAEYFQGIRSILVLPQYDQGEALNMTILMSEDPHGFSAENLPEAVWTSNLLGRAVHNLRVGEELKEAYRIIDEEMKIVSDIQHSLLPQSLPEIPGMDLAVHYLTTQRAGGDYYDFFPLPDGRWGIFIADVCGHGPAAAVLMAITHAIAHDYAEHASKPGQFLDHINRTLYERYTKDSKSFVTAFYGVYDPVSRCMTYSRAGHDEPRIRRGADGVIDTFESSGNLPLGVSPKETHDEYTKTLHSGDLILFYTDGITEAKNPQGELFGTDRIDAVFGTTAGDAKSLKRDLLDAVAKFADGASIDDDQTFLVAHLR
ncbi:MAG: PP2C family protein-serine/threonine phosphatase [Candidatus Hydrogenedentes bacterium]|nr:PP2C family protein-serine/threonine phosphatase [Candidatus Hydrogenedentota bacterium]